MTNHPPIDHVEETPMLDTLVDILSDAGACCGTCGREPGEPPGACEDCQNTLNYYALNIINRLGLHVVYGAQSDGAPEYVDPSTVSEKRGDAQRLADTEGAGFHVAVKFETRWLEVRP